MCTCTISKYLQSNKILDIIRYRVQQNKEITAISHWAEHVESYHVLQKKKHRQEIILLYVGVETLQETCGRPMLYFFPGLQIS